MRLKYLLAVLSSRSAPSCIVGVVGELETSVEVSNAPVVITLQSAHFLAVPIPMSLALMSVS